MHRLLLSLPLFLPVAIAAHRYAPELLKLGRQQLYDQLVADGSASLTAAYDVGEQIERLDIDDLTDAIATAQGRADLVRVYSNLRTGSTHHLAAFTR